MPLGPDARLPDVRVLDEDPDLAIGLGEAELTAATRVAVARTHVLERGTWAPPAVFTLVARLGSVEPGELERTFNLGIGMVAIVARDAADATVAFLRERGVPAWPLGEVVPGTGTASCTGTHPHPT